MRHNIKIHDKEIEYSLRVSNVARRMRLSIYCDGNFVVTVPKGIAMNLVEGFIASKAGWVIRKLDYFKKNSGRIFVKGTMHEFYKHKASALALAKQRVDLYNRIYGFKFNKISIKNQKTRWGSCSRRGNLSFNYKIALLPLDLADYLIVHELCHLGEFNHSAKFWLLVSQTVPDHKIRRFKLRSSGVKFG